MRCAAKILKDFSGGNSRLLEIKPLKVGKTHICLGIYNSRLKPIILTETIEKHYFIIAFSHVINLRGLGLKTNAKTAFKS